MKAVLAFHDKQVLPDGSIVEMKIWNVPQSVRGSAHGLKYSLFYGRSGERRVVYDNERDRKSTRLNSSHGYISYAVFCLKKKSTTSPDNGGGRARIQTRN